MQIELPDAVEEIISRLNEHGYEASAVGGCVRDSWDGRRRTGILPLRPVRNR